MGCLYPHLQRLGNVGVLEGGYGKGRFLLNAPLDRRWSLIGVDCDEVAFRRFQELISAKPNRTDIALCGDLVKGDLNLQAYNIEACVGMMFFHTLSHDGQLAVLRRMYELLPAAGCVYAGFLSTGSWRYEALAQKPECGEPVNLRKVMELDRVGVYTDLFCSFATESYLLGLGDLIAVAQARKEAVCDLSTGKLKLEGGDGLHTQRTDAHGRRATFRKLEAEGFELAPIGR